LVSDYLVLLDGSAGWAGVLERYDAEVILWPRGEALVELAGAAGDWRTVWGDDKWVVMCAPNQTAC
jgi:hypothetical protein